MMHKGPGRCPLAAVSVPQGDTVTHKQEKERRKTGVSWRKVLRLGQHSSSGKSQDNQSSTEQSEVGSGGRAQQRQTLLKGLEY